MMETVVEDLNHLNMIEGISHEPVANQKTDQFDTLFKVITIGDPASGKSSLLKRLVQNQFIEGTVTVGVEFQSYISKVDDKVIKLQIWDTAGQENFRSVTKVFYRNTHAVLLCYPINSRESFQNLQHWLNEVHAQCSPDVMIFVSGCKSDLEHQRQVTMEAARKFQLENNLVYLTESSALDGTNIQQMFIDMSKFLYSKFREEINEEEDRAASFLPGQSEGSRCSSIRTSSVLTNKGAVQKEVGKVVDMEVKQQVAQATNQQLQQPPAMQAPAAEKKKGCC